MVNLKKIKLIPLIAAFLSVMTVNSYAATVTSGFFGIDDYPPAGKSDDDRAGYSYVRNLNGELNALLNPSHTYTNTFMYKDSQAKRLPFISKANGDPCTLFGFSGHGYPGKGIGGGPLLYDGKANKTSLKFKHRYVVMYSCNWLWNGGSKDELRGTYRTFNGTRLQMGFGTQMWLDAREGIAYGQRLMRETVGSAFVNAARIFQPQNDKDVVVKVVGYTGARMDYITNSYPAAPVYNGRNDGQFKEHFNCKIKGTGKKITWP